MPSVLTGGEIRRLIESDSPLVEGCLNLDEQVQTNGFDLTLREISMFQSPGVLAADNSRRVVSALSPLLFDGLGRVHLAPGIYSITFNEVVHLPKDVMALATPRSSLLRCGVTVNTAVWDAGYSGRSQSLMVVYNQMGFQIERNARVIQLVFFRLGEKTDGYNGIYQGENIV
jgi:dUTP pyrophosphatase